MIRSFEGKEHFAFVVCGLLIGLAYAVVLPPLQAPDEFAHFYRAYSVSEGYLVGPDNISLPRTVAALSGEFQPHGEQYAPYRVTALKTRLLSPLNPQDRVEVRDEAMNIYIFLPYLPGAAGIAVGRLFHLSALGLLYADRISNLAVYVVLASLALRVLPDFKAPLLGLSLMPTVLHQAGSASWDGLAFAAAFLLTAYALRLSYGPAQGPLRTPDYVILAVLVAVNALLKTNVCLTLLTLLIPRSRFGGIRPKWAVFGGCLALIGLEIAAWHGIASHSFEAFRVRRLTDGFDVSENLHFMEWHPILFVDAVARTIRHQFFDLTGNFVATLGWLAVFVPGWVVGLYIAVLVAAAIMGAKSVNLPLADRGILFSAVIAALFGVFVALLYAETPRGYLQQLNAHQGYVPLIQGRYFVPMALAASVAISIRRLFISPAWMTLALLLTALIANGAALNGLASIFYHASILPPSDPSGIGVFRDGSTWILHSAGSRSPLEADADRVYTFGGIPGDVPITGDWNGDGRTKIGIFRPSGGQLEFMLDWDGDGRLTSSDRVYDFGSYQAGDIPVVGDWSGDGRTKIGICRQRYLWILDYNGNGSFDGVGSGKDVSFAFGGMPGDVPVVGDWNRDGRAKAGVFRQGYLWVLDGADPGAADHFTGASFAFGGITGDVPIVGDWNANGRAKVGVFRQGHLWVLDGADPAARSHSVSSVGSFGGNPGDVPVVGRW